MLKCLINFKRRFLPRFENIMKLLIDGQIKTHKIYENILREHQNNPIKFNNFLSSFNEEMQRRIQGNEDIGSFTEKQCFYLLADIHGAGVDTTLTTLRWFILLMAAYPEEQVKIYFSIKLCFLN